MHLLPFLIGYFPDVSDHGMILVAVNTASRMESNSEAGKIHCSERAATILRQQSPNIVLEPRGKITVKGKGEMFTFWVLSI